MVHSRVAKFFLLLFLFLSNVAIGRETSFIASFQTGIVDSYSAGSDVWMESPKKIPSLREFTVCHWIKLKFFNIKFVACLWSYCTVANETDEMECLEVCLASIENTANRNLRILGWMPLKNSIARVSKVLRSYRHRSWTHICWTFSAITGISRFYHDGILLGTDRLNTSMNDVAMKDSEKMFDTALIFGQEPDVMRGKFDNLQAFLGDLCEFNIWSYVLTTSNIQDMASCKSLMKGDILSWDKASWTTKNVQIQDISDPSGLCSIKSRYFVIPQKLRYSDATEICEIHGGHLAIPQSEEDTTFILDMFKKRKETCQDYKNLKNGNVMWIGAKKSNNVWYKDDSASPTGKTQLNYTELAKSHTWSTAICSYIRYDGSWWGEQHDCTLVSLCSVCEVQGEPVFTFKGVCSASEIDWNFYMSIDDQNQLKKYEGYKRLDIVHDEDNNIWTIASRPGHNKYVEANFSDTQTSLNYPIGRHAWFMKDPMCQVNEQERNMVFSRCDFPNEFTCDSGHCIDLNKRCDEDPDCVDGSDERLCDLLSIPSSYNKANPPKAASKKETLGIQMETQLISIDSIDTVNMEITITLEMKIKWFDKRLTFFNPTTNKNNFISKEIVSQIWTPLRDMIHESAIIGETKYGYHRHVKLLPSSPEDVDVAPAVEDRSFNGSANALELTQMMKMKHNCIFDVKKFPFDESTCEFVFKLNQNKEEPVSFLGDGKVVYRGSEIVGQFSIGNMYSEIRNTNESTKYIIVLPMSRLCHNQLLKTFIPTVVLWIFGYLTMFIEPDEDGFSNRYMGAGTALLVVATLLNAVSGDVPQTSYTKFVDYWFLWHVVNIFTMIAFHIALDRLRSYLMQCNEEDVIRISTISPSEPSKVKGWKTVLRVNNAFIIMYAILNGLFYVIYFILTI